MSTIIVTFLSSAHMLLSLNMPLDFSSFFAYTMSMELKQLFNKCYGKEWDKASIFEKIEAVVVLIISFQFVSHLLFPTR